MSITAPFQRRVINPLQRPLSSDLNLQAFYDSVTQSYLAGALYTGDVFSGTNYFREGFIGRGFQANKDGSSRGVIVWRGLGFGYVSLNDTEGVGGIAGVNEQAYAPVVCQPSDPTSAGVSLSVDALASGYARIDVVALKAPCVLTDYQNVGIANPSSSTFALSPKPQQLSFNVVVSEASGDLVVIKGAEVVLPNTPTAPALPSGYIALAHIAVPVGSGLLSASDITDYRRQILPSGQARFSVDFSSKLSVPAGGRWKQMGLAYAINPVYSDPAHVSGQKWFEVYLANQGLFAYDWQAMCGLYAAPASQDSAGAYHPISSAMLAEVSTVAVDSTIQSLFDSVISGGCVLGQSVQKAVVYAGNLSQNASSGNSVDIVMNANVNYLESSFTQAFKITVGADVSYA